jgi:hypothetical protein
MANAGRTARKDDPLRELLDYEFTPARTDLRPGTDKRYRGPSGGIDPNQPLGADRGDE